MIRVYSSGTEIYKITIMSVLGKMTKEDIIQSLKELKRDAERITSGNASHQRTHIMGTAQWLIDEISEGNTVKECKCEYCGKAYLGCDLLNKITTELKQYAFTLNGDICMPNNGVEMMNEKIRILNLVKHLNHGL